MTSSELSRLLEHLWHWVLAVDLPSFFWSTCQWLFYLLPYFFVFLIILRFLLPVTIHRSSLPSILRILLLPRGKLGELYEVYNTKCLKILSLPWIHTLPLITWVIVAVYDACFSKANNFKSPWNLNSYFVSALGLSVALLVLKVVDKPVRSMDDFLPRLCEILKDLRVIDDDFMYMFLPAPNPGLRDALLKYSKTNPVPTNSLDLKESLYADYRQLLIETIKSIPQNPSNGSPIHLMFLKYDPASLPEYKEVALPTDKGNQWVTLPEPPADALNPLFQFAFRWLQDLKLSALGPGWEIVDFKRCYLLELIALLEELDLLSKEHRVRITFFDPKKVNESPNISSKPPEEAPIPCTILASRHKAFFGTHRFRHGSDLDIIGEFIVDQGHIRGVKQTFKCLASLMEKKK